MVKITARKAAYRERLIEYLHEYKNILVINVDMVGSRQMQEVRLALRGRAQILMGKNTIIRKILREEIPNNPNFEDLLPLVVGNIGFVFTNDDLNEIRTVIQENKVPAAARTGLLAPIDVWVEPGPTGLDPGQTSFFQALNIATKIVRGTIEIITRVHLIEKDTRVSPSAVSLLQKLNVRPFFFAITVTHVYEDGSVYPAAVLDMSDDDLLAKFYSGVSKLSAVSLAIGTPNLATIPHSFARALKNLIALAVETDITFKAAEPFKEFLSDPEAYAAKHGIVAAPADEKKEDAAPAAAEPEEESESEGDMGFSLFD